jgi:hypothetical protein
LAFIIPVLLIALFPPKPVQLIILELERVPEELVRDEEMFSTPSFVSEPPETVIAPLTLKIAPGWLLTDFPLASDRPDAIVAMLRLFMVPELKEMDLGLKKPLLQIVPPLRTMLPEKFPVVSMHNASPGPRVYVSVSFDITWYVQELQFCPFAA